MTHAESALTIDVTLESANGQAELSVLPDSEADISAAGPELLQALGTNVQKLLPTDVSPKVADGRPMKALGAIPVRIRLHERTVATTIYTFEQVTGVLLSWKASCDLGILPVSYPIPPVHAEVSNQQVNATLAQVDVSTETIITEFPTVFEGQVKCMPGETFRTTLREDSKPFCVSTPRQIPLPYWEKLKEQLDTLLAANIIAPVTEPTDWCAPIVVAPKKY